MTIGIIGAGKIGRAIAQRLASAGIAASISNKRGPGSLASIVKELGSGITAAERAVAANSDIVFLAVPWHAHTDAISGLPPWNGRIVIDAMNAVSVGPQGLEPVDLAGRPSSQIVAEELTGARVVKAFNTLAAEVLAGDPRTEHGHRVLFMSGDDATAKREVSQLIERLGFAAIDIGDFEMGRRMHQYPAPLAGINLVKIG